MWKYLLSFLVLTIIGYMYEKYQNKQIGERKMHDHEIVKRFLLNEDALASSKPIVWVHLNYEYNSRNWFNFGSRSSHQLNQPYLYITMQSIVNKAGSDFNVCFIDDQSFGKLLPNWNVDMDKLADPVKGHMRHLALIKVLYYYGGMLVPPSYLALKELTGLYDTGLEKTDCFVVEGRNKNSSSTYVPLFPSHDFMGCKKESPVMKDLMLFTERLCSRDHTDEQIFLGELDKKCNEYVQYNKMGLVPGQLVGTADSKGKPVIIDQLLESSYIDFSPSMQGIWVPMNDIVSRTKYEWFARMSKKQLYTSDVILSKYLLLSNV